MKNREQSATHRKIARVLLLLAGMILPSWAQSENDPAKALPTTSLTTPTAPGKEDSISVEFKNADIVEVLKILGKKIGVNLILGANVKGRITMFLTQASVRDAFDLVLQSASLAYLEKGGILQVMTLQEFETLTGSKFNDLKKLTPIPVKNASATDVAASLSKLRPNTTILIDEVSNTLLVKDSPANVEELRLAVQALDQELSTQTFSPRYLEQKQTEDIVKAHLSKKGSYHLNPQANEFILTDPKDNLNRLLTLLQASDVPPKTLTKPYILNYAKFDAVDAKLKTVLTPVGKTIVDDRTNSILVTDLESNFQKIEEVIRASDNKDLQVLIEAKLVQVILNDQFQFGINWQSVIENVNKSSLGLKLLSSPEAGDLVEPLGFSESVNALGKVKDILTAPTDTTTTTFTDTRDTDALGETTTTASVNRARTLTETNEQTASETAPFNTRIKFPTEGGGRIVATGTIDGRQFEGVLNALKAVGDTQVLSSPRINALNNSEAKIQVATKEAYVNSTIVTPGTGPSTTSEQAQFIDVGIVLSVTPTINADGFITMTIKPSVSSVTSTVTTASGNKIPIVSTQGLESKVQVKDGTTILLGGLHEQLKDKASSGIPFLSEIPLIGILFKKWSRHIRNSELVVFLTPHVLTGEKSFFEEEKLTPVSAEARQIFDSDSVDSKKSSQKT